MTRFRNGESLRGIKYRFLAWMVLSVAFLFVSLRQPFGIFGDGLEYIVQTQSFVFDRSLTIDAPKRAEYWNQTNPFQVLLSTATSPKVSSNFQLSERSQAGGGFGSLYPGKDGRFYYIHSWIYSLTVSPIYCALHLLSKVDGLPRHLEYFSFQLFNSLILAAALCFSVQCIYGIMISLFLIFTPLTGYLGWTTPEVFQFSLLAIAFSRAKLNQRLSPILVGLAAAQNFPLLGFFLPLMLLQIDKPVPRQVIKCAPNYILPTFIGLFPWLIYQLNFGTPNLIVSIGQASLSNCSLPRLISFLLSPTAGVIWFYPCLLLLIPTLFTKREGILGLVALIVLTLILSFAMTGMVNFHSQQIGTARYAAWIFAPIAGLLISSAPNRTVSFRFWNTIGVFAVVVLTYFYQNWSFVFGNHPRTNYLSVLPAQAARLYRFWEFDEEPELLVEVLRQQELVSPWEFNSRYEIPIGNNEALCLVSLRSTKNDRKKFIPSDDICPALEIPDPKSSSWKRSSVLGGYYLRKVSKL